MINKKYDRKYPGGLIQYINDLEHNYAVFKNDLKQDKYNDKDMTLKLYMNTMDAKLEWLITPYLKGEVGSGSEACRGRERSTTDLGLSPA